MEVKLGIIPLTVGIIIFFTGIYISILGSLNTGYFSNSTLGYLGLAFVFIFVGVYMVYIGSKYGIISKEY